MLEPFLFFLILKKIFFERFLTDFPASFWFRENSEIRLASRHPRHSFSLHKIRACLMSQAAHYYFRILSSIFNIHSILRIWPCSTGFTTIAFQFEEYLNILTLYNS